MDLVEAIQAQAAACGQLGSPMYDDLLRSVAQDVATGGPADEVLAGFRDSLGPEAVALRLAGSVHRLVLERRAGDLAVFYPSVGGSWEHEQGWIAFRRLLAEQPEAVAEWLGRPPQTNEVGRASALFGGLCALGEVTTHPVRLFEIGSSAGLLLLADRFTYRGPEGQTRGPADSPVLLDPAWTGAFPGSRLPQIVERVGSDLDPIDARSADGRLALTAYVWADQVHRHERLRGALALAQETDFEVRRASAAELVGSLALVEGTTTVLWHSVMWQYLGRDEQERVSAQVAHLGAQARPEAPFAHLFLEPTRRAPTSDHEFLVVLETWPGGVRRILGTAHPHGLPAHWG